MIQKLKTIESTTKIIASTIAGLVAILAALISIYRGIRDLNITATKLVDTIPVVEHVPVNMKCKKKIKVNANF